MPRYLITTPAGRRIEVNAPEGATLEDAYEYVASMYPDPEASALDRAGDFGLDVAKGVIGLGEAVIGVGDIISGGRVGKGMEQVGYRPEDAKGALSDLYSDERKLENKQVADADGFVGTLGAMTREPATIAGAVGESLPQMLGGGAIAKGINVGSVAARAAFGEGLLSAGSSAESMRQQTEDGLLTPTQQASAAMSGVGTGLLSGLGATVARKTGLADIDSVIAGGGAGQVGHRARKIIGGAISEGVLEEMPQSMQEQAWQNYALGRPIGNEVPEAGATGLLTGAAPGATINALRRGGATGEDIRDDYRDLAKRFDATITSLVRSPEKNKAVNGVANSQHITGTAGDFVVPENQKQAFIAEARSRGYEAIDEGDHIHLELPPGARRPTTTRSDDDLTPGQRTVREAIQRAREGRSPEQTKAPEKREGRLDDPIARPPMQQAQEERQRPGESVSEPIDNALEALRQRQRQILDEAAQRTQQLQQVQMPPAGPPRAPPQAPPPSEPLPPIQTRPQQEPVQQQAPMPPTGPAQQQVGPAQQQPPMQPPMAPQQEQLQQQPPAPPFEPVQQPPQQPTEPFEPFEPPPQRDYKTPVRLQPAIGESNRMSDFVRQVFNNDRQFLRAQGINRKLSHFDVREIKLSPAQQRQFDMLGEILGRKIVFYEMPGEGITAFASDDRHIFVNVKGANNRGVNLMSLVGHEFLHTLSKEGNADAKALIAMARAYQRKDNQYVRGRRQMYQQIYKGRQGDFEDMLAEELTADFVGDLLANREFWIELERNDPSLFRRVLRKLIQFLDRLSARAARIGDENAFHETNEMKQLATRMLQEHMQRVGNQRGRQDASAASEPMASMEWDSWLPKDTPENKPYEHLAMGNNIEANRVAERFITDRAPPRPMKTPEAREFLKGSKVGRSKLPGHGRVYFHGTARDITRFRPKQGEAVFLSPSSHFAGRFSGLSQDWVNVNDPNKVTVRDFDAMQLREREPVGSTMWLALTVLLENNGDPKAAIKQLRDGYMYETDMDIVQVEDYEAEEAIEMIATWQDERAIKAADTTGRPGMNVMPLVTNVKNTFDYENKAHRKVVMDALKEQFEGPNEAADFLMDKAAGHIPKFYTWQSFENSLSDGNWVLIEAMATGIRSLGFDSYHVMEEGVKNLAVFDPKMVKSATGNVGTFGTREPTEEEAASLGMTREEAIAAQNDGDIRLSVMPGAMQSALNQTFVQKMQNAPEQLERWLLDEFRDLREIQKVIGQQYFGGTLPDELNAHRKENLRHGAYKDEREKAEDRFIEPISKILSRVDATAEEFSDYLWWRHAPERDAYLRSHLDPGISDNIAPDALAGISPQDAIDNINNLDPAKRKAFENAAKHIDAMREFTLDTMVKSGEMSEQHRDSLLQQYEFYVPLRGLPDADEIMRTGRPPAGMNMNRNPAGPRAKGRKSKPDFIMEEMVKDMDLSLVGKQKQRVLEAMTLLVATHPDPDLWAVDPVKVERQWVNGVLTIAPVKSSENTITYMHKGVPVAIQIKHPQMLAAFRGMTEPLPKWLRFVGRITRWLSAVKTSLSPFFMLVNPVRDIGLATMAVGAERGAAAVKAMGEYYLLTYPALFRDRRSASAAARSNLGPRAQKLQQYTREFSAVGGKTGYTYVTDIREQQRKLSSLMTRHAKSKGMQDIMAGRFHEKDADLLIAKAWQHTANLFEVANEMAENSTRLAVYAAMRDGGMSMEQAAEYAKEVTVNFNRRGSFGKVLNGFYMFFNAAMQGSARLVRLSTNKKFVAMMGSLFASSYALALGQMLAAGDDDDGESNYDKAIPNSQAERTISIYLGDGKSLALPVPYGPNIFSYMGYRLARLHYNQMRGKDDPFGRVAGDIAAQMVTSMSPIDPGDGATRLAPEPVRVLLHTYFNKSDFGGKLNPRLGIDKDTDPPKPYYRETYDSTGGFYRVIAGALNAASGGDLTKGGAINLSGEQVRYLTQQATGGLGRLASESAELAHKMFMGIDPEPSDVPLANVYLRGKGHARHAGPYYDNLNELEAAVSQWKSAVSSGSQPHMEKLAGRYPWIEGAELSAGTKLGKEVQAGTPMEAARETTQAIRELRDMQEAVRADQSLSERERAKMLWHLDRQIAEVQKDFNYAFNAANARR